MKAESGWLRKTKRMPADKMPESANRDDYENSVSANKKKWSIKLPR